MSEIINFILHVDSYLLELTQNYGVWIYAILFAIVFAETGLVVTPFLPGDSLLFATGALAATGALDVRVATVLVIIAAIAGDAVNYSIGRSALDRVAGVGGKRKKALLSHFGSVRAIETAGLLDLERVPGISKAVARAVYDAFHEGS